MSRWLMGMLQRNIAYGNYAVVFCEHYFFKFWKFVVNAIHALA